MDLSAVTCRRILCCLCLFTLVVCDLGAAQKRKKKRGDQDGMLPVIITDTKKDKDQEVTQTLPVPKELPVAVSADAGHLVFQTAPLSGHGLFSQQTRDSLKTLLRSNRGNIVKLRAFVTGAGDMRRVSDIASELWTDKHLPLPALSIVQVGALPLAEAQVALESIAVDKDVVNANGLKFLPAKSEKSLAAALDALTAEADGAPVLCVTCYLRSLENNAAIRNALATRFPRAAVTYVQMQRNYGGPVAACEAVAAGNAIAPSARLVFTGTQLGFGERSSDIKLAFERLEKALAGEGASLKSGIYARGYSTSRHVTAELHQSGKQYFPAATPFTILPFEGLPSLDATFAVDVIAAVGDNLTSALTR